LRDTQLVTSGGGDGREGWYLVLWALWDLGDCLGELAFFSVSCCHVFFLTSLFCSLSCFCCVFHAQIPNLHVLPWKDGRDIHGWMGYAVDRLGLELLLVFFFFYPPKGLLSTGFSSWLGYLVDWDGGSSLTCDGWYEFGCCPGCCYGCTCRLSILVSYLPTYMAWYSAVVVTAEGEHDLFTSHSCLVRVPCSVNAGWSAWRSYLTLSRLVSQRGPCAETERTKGGFGKAICGRKLYKRWRGVSCWPKFWMGSDVLMMSLRVSMGQFARRLKDWYDPSSWSFYSGDDYRNNPLEPLGVSSLRALFYLLPPRLFTSRRRQ